MNDAKVHREDARLASSRRAPAAIAPDDVLLGGLRALLDYRDEHGRFELAARNANPYTSSCPSEIVVVNRGGCAYPPLFCKYETRGAPPPSDHRRGVAYEARVWRDLLAPLGASVPRVLGTWQRPGFTCLVVEACTSALPLRKLGSRRIVDAAGWLGRFHADASPVATRPTAAFAFRYDAAHFVGWMHRVQAGAATLGLSLPWLPALAKAFAQQVAALANAEPTLIHGEFYPMNILATETEIWPIDWESAGIGPGEIDLASLIMGWPTTIAAEAFRAYATARWRGRAPTRLPSLATAHLYLCLRMLGDNSRPRRQPTTPFFDYLLQQAKACGFLPALGDG